MRWSLILLVSALGVLMGVVKIFGILDVNQWVMSFALWVVSALILGRFAQKKYFSHGLWTGIISAVVSSLLTFLFWDSFTANNAEVAERMSQVPEGMDVRMISLIGLPISAAISGVVLGLLTLLAGKVFGEPPEPPKSADSNLPQS